MDNNTNIDGKKCCICGEFKKFTEFHKRATMKDGYKSQCKICINKYYRDKYIKKPKPIITTPEDKVCKTCKQTKEITEFYKRKSNRDGYQNDCKECHSLNTKEHYQKNIINHKQRCRDYHKNNAEEIKKRKKENYKENKKHIRAKNKMNYEENKERFLEYAKQYREENRDIIHHKAKIYYSENREKFTKYNLKRRSYKHKVAFTPIERQHILDRDNWTCQNCNCKVHDRHTENWNTPDKAHIDHIIPISKGGNSEPKNLQILCRTCNLSKADNIEAQLSFFG